jgi:hypothetical protein
MVKLDIDPRSEKESHVISAWEKMKKTKFPIAQIILDCLHCCPQKMKKRQFTTQLFLGCSPMLPSLGT